MKRNSLIFMLLAALFMPLALHAQQALPYEYSFEDQDLTIDGWTTSNLVEGSEIVQLYSSGDNLYVFAFYYTTNPPQYLISPLLTGTENGVSVEFQYACYRTDWGDETFQVGYSTTTNAPDSFTWDTEITASNALYNGADWLTYEKNFPAGTKYVAIKHTSDDKFYLFVDDFSFATPASCAKPTGLTVDNVDNHTATLSWTSDASSWQICINDDESNLITTNQNPYTLTNLDPETVYTVKVRTKCSNTDLSNWSSDVAFITDIACPAPTITLGDITATSANITWTGTANNYNLRYREAVGFNYGFETATPWVVDDFAPCTTYDGDGGSTYGFSSWSFPNQQYTGACIAFNNDNDGSSTMRSHSGDAFGVMFNTAGPTDDWFILPEITIAQNDVFSFWCREITNQYGPEIINVGIYGSEDGTFASYLAQEIEINETEWTQYSYNLSAYVGQTIRLAINCVSDDVFGFMFDDIFVGNPNITWPSAISATSPYPITGLTPETQYEVQVQAVCGGQDGSSEWSSVFFTTLPTCLAPSNLTVYNITTTDAWLSWDGNGNSYKLKVNGQQYNNVTSPYHLTGLTVATSYIIEVQAVCTDGTSDWSLTTFVTELCEEADKCVLTFELTDSYGDTWNGNAIKVVDVATNSVIATLTNDYDNYTATGTSGAYTQTKQLAVCNGRQIQFVMVRGSYPSEATWVITDLNSDTLSIGTGSNYSDGATIKTYTVDCTVTSCRYPTDLTVANFTPTSATLTWTEKGDASAWVVSYTIGSRTRTINASTTEATITSLTPGTSFSAKVRPVCDVNNRWSDPINFTLPDNFFINNGNWNEGSSWYGGSVPAEGSDVAIQANAIVPAGYTAILGEEVIFTNGGSITVADGGQLINYDIEDLEVTMEKNVPAYTGDNDNYKLLAFPFTDYPDVPADMTFATGKDFYLFDNSLPGEEWQNNRADTIYYVSPKVGYLYANPTATTVSMSGTTFTTSEYGSGYTSDLYYDDTENEVNGWYLLGNPYTSNAYIYGASSSLFAMDVMYYDANGNMQTISAGPVPPMQGFFVKITEDTRVFFLAEEYDLSSKAPLRAIVDKKADNAATTVDKKKAMKLKLFNNPSAPSRDFKPFNLLKK